MGIRAGIAPGLGPTAGTKRAPAIHMRTPLVRRSRCHFMMNAPARITALTFLLFLFSGPLPAAAQTGPVAAYGFNEGTGTTVADATGNGRIGTVSGAIWNGTGRFGSSLTFD